MTVQAATMGVQPGQERVDAEAEGYAAASYAECPYVSGQRLLSDWHDGFIAKCMDTGVTPPDTPLYVLGQIAFLNGIPCSQMPAGEVATGRWMSGWLRQRDRNPTKVFPRAGGNLLDDVFCQPEGI